MKSITIDNFKTQTLRSYVTNKPEFFHQAFSGLSPVFNLRQTTDNLYNYHYDVAYPLAPLLTYNTYTDVNGYGAITSITRTKTNNGKGNAIVITQKSRVLAISDSGFTSGGDFGYPTGSAITDTAYNDLCSFNGQVIAVLGNDTTIYRKAEDNTGSWATFGGSINPRYCEVMGNYLYVGNKPSGFLTPTTEIKIFNTSYTELTPSFKVGSSDIIDFKPINDSYFVVVARSSKSSNLYYVYFWDGTPNNAYNNSVTISGKYIGISNVGQSYFLVVKDSENEFSVYQIVGYQLALKKRFNGVNVKEIFNGGTGIAKVGMTSLADYLVIPVTNLSNTAINAAFNEGLLFYNPIVDEAFLEEGKSTINGVSNYFGTNNGVLEFNASTNTTFNRHELSVHTSSSTNFYLSNYIKVSNELINITGIELYYDGSIDSNSQIEVKVYYTDDSNRVGHTTKIVSTISNNGLARRTYIPTSIMCDKFKVGLIWVKSPSWSGIIKKVVVYYDEINKSI
jgi:hypothetical protein